MKNKNTPSNSLPEGGLAAQSAAFLEMLTKRGIVEDQQIHDGRIRQIDMEKKRKMFHNTQLLLQNYRDIVWALECFPSNIAEELNAPMKDLDALLSLVSSQIDMDNRKLENRLLSIQRSRMLLDRLNEALSILKQKPKSGPLMYDIVYQRISYQRNSRTWN